MSIEDKNRADPLNNSMPRRRAFAKLAAGGAAAVVLPGTWSKPIVNSVLLPAHAETSPGPGVRIVTGGGSGSASQSGSLAPPRSFAQNLVDFFVPTARAVGAFSDYCVEIEVEENDAEITAVTVTKYCWDLCDPGVWVDRTTGPFSLTYDGGADEWSGKADGDCCTLRISNIDTASAVRLADVTYGSIDSVIVPGDTCDCTCDR